MLITLEGLDGTGKSTLAAQLAEKLAPTGTVTVIHAGPPTAHPLDEYLTPLLDYRPETGQHWILDRWHIGERVYPALRGRETQFDDTMFWYVNQYVRRLGGITVWCQRTRGGLEQTYRERGEKRELTEIDAATKLFTDALAEAGTPQLAYGFETKTEHIDARDIINWARSWESAAAPLARYVTYVGPPRPRYLLLGEVRHGLDRVEQLVTRTDRRPAFVPYKSTSGHWLLETLLADPRFKSDVGIANARDVDDVYALWRDLGKPPTVTLGRHAHREAALYADFEHGQVPHPQYFRRFFNRQRAEYRALLAAAFRTNGDFSKWHASSTAPAAPPSIPKLSALSVTPERGATPATVPSTT